ncbi:hypothetical protein LTR85_008071 [Meristemomyces frigidus]|nr:hypothetical protein LTR85_008071 [Meristemomyces frigidus]
MARFQDLVPQYLYTERLTLELFNRSQEHYDIILSTMNTQTAHTTMGDFGIRTPAQFDEFFGAARIRDNKFKDGRANGDLMYLIRLGPHNAAGELIGAISLAQQVIGGVVVPPDAGWMIAEAHMGKGYATEAAQELMRWVTKDFGMKDVTVIASTTNPASNSVAEKLGFVEGGQIPDGDRPGKTYNVLILPGMEKIDIKEALAIKRE